MHTTTTAIIFVLLMAGAWWLSSYDSKVTGENKSEDFIRRAIRCGITVLLFFLATLNSFFAIFIILAMAVLWASCVAEFFSRRFHNIVDPEDDRKFDPKEVDRDLDLLAQMVREGRNSEALDFCKKLEKSGEVSSLALEATLHRLYQQILDSVDTSPFFMEVRKLSESGKFEEAESRLKQIIAAQPKNWAALLLLMRVYAEGLSQPQKALALLEPVAKQPQLHPAFIKYARQSIHEWSAPVKVLPMDFPLDSSSEEVPEEVSLNDLLENNQLATAVEFLENAIAADPQNFDLWLKLAEVHGVNCADLNRAGKIIQKMESSAAFTPREIELAKARLREWRAGRR